MQCQADLLLAGGGFLGEAVGRQGIQSVGKVGQIDLAAVIGLGTVVALAAGGEGVAFGVLERFGVLHHWHCGQ